MTGSLDAERGRPWRTAAGLGLVLAAAVLAFLLIRAYGETLVAPDPAGAVRFGGAGGERIDVLLHVLLALAVVVLAARAAGALFRHLGQPPVMGEVLAGILLGPSLLGRVAPDLSAFLLPASVAPVLGVVAQVGVILYMFLVGLELNPALLRKRTHAAVAISHTSIVAPFLLGAALALWLYPRLSTRDVPFTVFALFMGVSLSVTAFPVLARILTDQGIQRTRIGALALTCAAVDDVTAWCLLAGLVGVARAEASDALLTLALTGAYVALMFVAVRPALSRLVVRYEGGAALGRGVLGLLLAGVLVSSLATEAIGVHALFGAFLLGAVIPHDSVLARTLAAKLEDVVVVLLLPAFFAFTGMRTEIGLVSGAGAWLVCAVIILVASLGKFGGTLLAARATGLDWRDASALGVLMNTRGLMELIVLNVGLDLGVISPALFAMLVLMALVTTFATTPILDRLVRVPSAMAAGDVAPAKGDL